MPTYRRTIKGSVCILECRIGGAWVEVQRPANPDVPPGPFGEGANAVRPSASEPPASDHNPRLARWTPLVLVDEGEMYLGMLDAIDRSIPLPMQGNTRRESLWRRGQTLALPKFWADSLARRGMAYEGGDVVLNRAQARKVQGTCPKATTACRTDDFPSGWDHV